MFSKKDLYSSIITGLFTGFVAWKVFVFLELPELFNIPWASLTVVVPTLWILGVNLGYFLGRWFKFFNQFGKFVAVGFTNAAVDFGILNLLIFYSGIASGGMYSIFKSISFVFALLHSYFWNKFWVFSTNENQGSGVEFAKFATVVIAAFLVNVAVASVVVNFVGASFGLNDNVWANVGAAVGAAVGLVVNFIGLRKVVFKKQDLK